MKGERRRMKRNLGYSQKSKNYMDDLVFLLITGQSKVWRASPWP
jgi:hypothetical protein